MNPNISHPLYSNSFQELNGWNKWNPSECEYKEKHWFAYALGIFLICGVFVSWGSQHMAIIRRKSSKGISWMTMLLANISTSCNTINVILEDFDTTIRCCGIFGSVHCNEQLLSTYQIASGWVNSIFVFFLILYYFPVEFTIEEQIVNVTAVTPLNSSDTSVSTYDETFEKSKIIMKPTNQVSKRRATISFIMYILICLFLFPAIGVLLYAKYGGASNSVTLSFAFALGIIATVANVLQYTPQIIKTLIEKEVGSLSIVMLLLQAPGSFMVVVFQLFFYHENVSTWLPFFITGIQQIILLVICIVFEIRNRRRKPSEEKEPLLTPKNI